jgi:hypothetical protein
MKSLPPTAGAEQGWEGRSNPSLFIDADLWPNPGTRSPHFTAPHRSV